LFYDLRLIASGAVAAMPRIKSLYALAKKVEI